MAEHRNGTAPVDDRALSARRTLGPVQALVMAGLAAAFVFVCVRAPAAVLSFGHVSLWVGFALASALRVAALTLRPARQEAPVARGGALPRYTVIAPLYREGAVVPQLIAALGAIDYPRSRLEILIALEVDDLATAAAVRAAAPSSNVRIVVVPPGRPRTKPRALNHALAEATGEYVVVYDAEDRPDPGQLREAVQRFRSGPPELACLQAPLRITAEKPGFLQSQFAAEYAALFEVLLPAFARLGLPFPLGGTSNHFRAEALRAVGGWDAWNVTEDADLGFRLWRAGGRLGVLTRPTLESAPRNLREWLPQRARWIKGHVQTWLVHMRRPIGLGVRGFLAFQATLGLGLLSAICHAPVVAVVLASLLVTLLQRVAPVVPPPDLGLLAAGWTVAGLMCGTALRHTGGRYRIRDALAAPFYWSLQTLAFVCAAVQLVLSPHHWDKTDHHPVAAPATDAGRLAA